MLIVGPLTMKLGTLIYYDKSTLKHELQVCKQQQTASGNKMVFVPQAIKCCFSYNFLYLSTLEVKKDVDDD